MSRELLKRASSALDEGLMGTEAISLSEEIETYLAQPDPEPFLFVRDAGIFYEFTDCDDPIGFPVYTEQPDQSARVAELEKHLLAALEGQKAETLLKNAAISSLEQQLAAKDARVAELKDELLAVWDKYESTGAELCAVKQQLAALQAKIEGGIRTDVMLVMGLSIKDKTYALKATTEVIDGKIRHKTNATLLIDDGVDI